MTYDTPRFYSKIEPKWGKLLWEFLNREDIVDRMKADLNAGKSAAEDIIG